MYMMRNIIFFIALLSGLLVNTAIQAQMTRTVYQTFAVDSAEVIALDLVGFTQVEIRAWTGTTVLVEVTPELYSGSPEILNKLIEVGRYKLALLKENSTASISTETREFKKLKRRDGTEMLERAKVILFVPDFYSIKTELSNESSGTIVSSGDDWLVWNSGANENFDSSEDRSKFRMIAQLAILPRAKK
jgi:hypothetical protein